MSITKSENERHRNELEESYGEAPVKPLSKRKRNRIRLKLLGDAFRRLRRTQKLTQRDLVNRTDIAQPVISRFEKSGRGISLDNFILLLSEIHNAGIAVLDDSKQLILDEHGHAIWFASPVESTQKGIPILQFKDSSKPQCDPDEFREEIDRLRVA